MLSPENSETLFYLGGKIIFVTLLRPRYTVFPKAKSGEKYRLKNGGGGGGGCEG